MRSGQLHQLLHSFAAEAAQALNAATAAGDEVGFEVVEERARTHRPALYCYRPLTGAFIARHWSTLRGQPSALAALAEIARIPGVAGYLETHAATPGETGLDDPADAALRAFTARVFDGDDKSFLLLPERFEPAYRELFASAVEQHTDIALLGLLRGVSSSAKELSLGDGILLAPLERLGRVPPDPAWARDDRPALVVAIDPGEGSDGVAEALHRLLELQTAMRLYAGGVSLAPLAWIHADGTDWRALSLPGGGPCDGNVVLVGEQEEELRAFCSLVARRRPTDGVLAWALRRFELGCSREGRLEGLSDHLLALRALLEPEGPGSGRLAGRLAALSAEGPERGELTKRMLRALTLEQAVICGEELLDGAFTLATEVEERLRAVLREVIAGELRGDLAALADARIYVPEVDAGADGIDEFQVTRRALASSFGADLFSTPNPGLRRPTRARFEPIDDAFVDAPTTELHL
jgi:hypothetical protein